VITKKAGEKHIEEQRAEGRGQRVSKEKEKMRKGKNEEVMR